MINTCNVLKKKQRLSDVLLVLLNVYNLRKGFLKGLCYFKELFFHKGLWHLKEPFFYNRTIFCKKILKVKTQYLDEPFWPL